MRILVTIPHYIGPPASGFADDGYGSTGTDRGARVAALTECIAAWHRCFRPQAMMIGGNRRYVVRPIGDFSGIRVDVVVVTVAGRHIVDELPLPAGLLRHVQVDTDPMMLGFECHRVLAGAMGQYDYYCYCEDDLVVADNAFFDKLAWFSSRAGEDRVLLPNRFETQPGYAFGKLYIDHTSTEALPPQSVDPGDTAIIKTSLLDRDVMFRRPAVPHAGCFFLNERQMRRWMNQPFFGDRDTGYHGPLESAATLGLIRTFKLYKPSPQNSGFLEILHACNRYLGNRMVPLPASNGTQ